MSLATRPRRPSKSLISTSVPEPRPSAPPTRTRRVLVAEAPERRALMNKEAPEIDRRHPTEAPDAGEARAAGLEREFTHGRSRS